MSRSRITVDPRVMGGQPCIRGLRMPAATLIKLVAAGMTTRRILREYPFLEAEDIKAALEFAASLAEDRHIAPGPSR